MKRNTSPKSVCFVYYRKFPDTNFENYSYYLSENGYDVTVIAYLAPGQENFELYGKRKIHRVKLPKKPSSVKSQIVFMVEVIKFLRSKRFSIVHIHHTSTYFLMFKIFGKKGPRYVFHLTSHPVSKSILRIKKRMIVIFLQSLFMDRLIIQSEELKEKLLGVRKLKKAQVIPVGFNKNLFYPTNGTQKAALRERLGIQNDNTFLLYIGSISMSRELDRLISAFEKVTKKIKKIKLNDGWRWRWNGKYQITCTRIES